MQQQEKIEVSEFFPSFNCYSSNSLTSTAATKVIQEQQAAGFHKFGDIDGDDFEFSFQFSYDEASAKEIDSRGWTVFPVFNRDLLVKNEEDREIESNDDEIDASASVTSSLQKLFIDEPEPEPEESSSCSSSEADELETLPSGTYCVWRPKAADGGSSPLMTKCKKSSSTGSGSKRWRIRYLLRRSNSEGKEPVVLLTHKKADSPKQKRNSGEVSKVAGRFKAQTAIHEQFYVQKRTENEVGKGKSYLPYRQDLVGFFPNVNGMGKMFPF